MKLHICTLAFQSNTTGHAFVTRHPRDNFLVQDEPRQAVQLLVLIAHDSPHIVAIRAFCLLGKDVRGRDRPANRSRPALGSWKLPGTSTHRPTKRSMPNIGNPLQVICCRLAIDLPYLRNKWSDALASSTVYRSSDVRLPHAALRARESESCRGPPRSPESGVFSAYSVSTPKPLMKLLKCHPPRPSVLP